MLYNTCFGLPIDQHAADSCHLIIMPPTVAKGAISVAFVRSSVRLPVCLFVAYIANNNNCASVSSDLKALYKSFIIVIIMPPPRSGGGGIKR